MAHVVGVPKREPCQRCGNPVFLAERLIIGNALYHRTCLRCARCESQLTLGSFYETETDGVYCCETCPDEEKKIQISQRLSNSGGGGGGGIGVDSDEVDKINSAQSRQSFNEKLAMFQTNGKGFLQKSMSDEEKSKSLKRLSEFYTKNTQADGSTENSPAPLKPARATTATHDESSSENSESDSSSIADSEDELPPLPETKPPSLCTDESDTESQPPLPKTKPPPIASKLNVLQKIQNADNSNKFNRLSLTHASTIVNSHNNNDGNNSTTINTKIPQSSSPQQHVNATSAIESHEHQDNIGSIIQQSHPNTNRTINEQSSSSSSPSNVKSLDDISCSSSNNVINDNCNVSNERSASPTNDGNVFAQSTTNNKEINENINLDKNENTNDNDTMPSDALNSFTNVTKEDKNYEANNKTKGNEKVEERTEPSTDGGGETEEKDNERLYRSISNNNECNIINRDSVNNMVRSRLSQFEALLQNEAQRTGSDNNKSINHNKLSVDNNDTNKPIEESKQQQQQQPQSEENHLSIDNIKFNELNITSDNDDQVPTDEQLQFNANDTNETGIINSANENANSEQSEIERNSGYHNSESHQTTSSAIDKFEKPVPVKRVTKEQPPADDSALAPPTPLKRKSKIPTAASDNLTASTDQLNSEEIEEVTSKTTIDAFATEPLTPSESNKEEKYPENLNPFGSDEDEETNDFQLRTKNPRLSDASSKQLNNTRDTTNPFDSSDDQIELLKDTSPQKKYKQRNLYKQRVSTNPFGSESDDDDEEVNMTPSRRNPVPAPRTVINGSSTPEPSPRMSRTLQPKMYLTTKNVNDFYGSHSSLISSTNGLIRNNNIHGSMNSLASSSTSTPRHRKGKAPAPPTPSASLSPAAYSASNLSTPMKQSRNSSPSSSIGSRATPLVKKKRAAPAPPPPTTPFTKSMANDTLYVTAKTRLDDSLPSYDSNFDSLATTTATDSSIDSSGVSTQNELLKDSGNDSEFCRPICETADDISDTMLADGKRQQKKLIPLDASLMNDVKQTNLSEATTKTEDNVTYRRTIVPLNISDIGDDAEKTNGSSDRQWEKMKENKESQNKNRQSQHLITPANANVDANSVYGTNKSSYGKWKRRKGPAPSLPVPPRKVIQMPLQEIRHELEVIEVQQQGLEKQGVMLEKMIRERCEGTENENTPLNEFKPNTKEVEDLILQLFELVNEKNELFRRQAELMYLRRQHRLEQEQADIEYEIRVLMAQPECNKTDSDKAREEALITRLVEIVQLRNKVIESLEMDRLREAEEDQSIKESLELHTAKRDEELSHQTPTKLSKKEKKKQKEAKKLAKQKKVDADKDADESELSQQKIKEKKKKKKFLSILN